VARAFRETEFVSVTILIVRGVMFRPFSNLTRSANAVHRNLILLKPKLGDARNCSVLHLGDHQDQIIAPGARDYPPTAGEFDAGQPVVRAILGG
jgi:hypothetical protein